MLFKLSEGKGVKFKSSECKSYGTFEPWWDVSDVAGLCESGLAEGTPVGLYIDIH